MSWGHGHAGRLPSYSYVMLSLGMQLAASEQYVAHPGAALCSALEVYTHLHLSLTCALHMYECAQVAVSEQLARCPAAAAPHPACLHFRLDHILTRAFLPAARPEGCIRLHGVSVHLQDGAEAEARLQPWLLGRSEASADVSSILPDLPEPQPDRPMFQLQAFEAELGLGRAEQPASPPPSAAPSRRETQDPLKQPPPSSEGGLPSAASSALEQGLCQVSSSGLGVHLHADALLGALSVAAALKASLLRVKQHLDPHLRAQVAQAAVGAAEATAAQGSHLPAAAAAAGLAAAEREGASVSDPGQPARKLRALAGSTVLVVRVGDSSLALQMADDVTWALAVGQLSARLEPGQLPTAALQGLGARLNHSTLLTAQSIEAAPLHIARDVYPGPGTQSSPGGALSCFQVQADMEADG